MFYKLLDYFKMVSFPERKYFKNCRGMVAFRSGIASNIENQMRFRGSRCAILLPVQTRLNRAHDGMYQCRISASSLMSITSEGINTRYLRDVTWDVNGLPMRCLWDAHDLPMECPRDVPGDVQRDPRGRSNDIRMGFR